MVLVSFEGKMGLLITVIFFVLVLAIAMYFIMQQIAPEFFKYTSQAIWNITLVKR